MHSNIHSDVQIPRKGKTSALAQVYITVEAIAIRLTVTCLHSNMLSEAASQTRGKLQQYEAL